MYDSKLKYKWDNKNVFDYAVSTAKAEGIAEGMEKGIAEGMAESIAEGFAEGKAEGKYQKAVAIAKELKIDGLPLAQISKWTKLSIEEIDRL